MPKPTHWFVRFMQQVAMTQTTLAELPSGVTVDTMRVELWKLGWFRHD